jgi:YfiH family protein
MDLGGLLWRRITLQADLLADFEHGFFTRQWQGQGPQQLAGYVGAGITVHRLTQVHGATVLAASRCNLEPWPEADGLISDRGGQSLWARGADCTPVLIADRRSGRVAVCHAGWRGVAARILPKAIGQLEAAGSRRDDLVVALGPAISGECYQVESHVTAQVAQGLWDRQADGLQASPGLGSNALGSAALEATVPGASAPGSTTLAATAPGSTAWAATAWDATTLDATALEAISPGSTALGSQGPKPSVPGSRELATPELAELRQKLIHRGALLADQQPGHDRLDLRAATRLQLELCGFRARADQFLPTLHRQRRVAVPFLASRPGACRAVERYCVPGLTATW